MVSLATENHQRPPCSHFPSSSCPGLAEASEANTGYGCPYLFAQILTDDLLNLLPGALWGLAVQHFEGAGVLLRQQVVKCSQVLSHLDEGASVGTAQLPEALSRAQVHLRRDQNISQALLLSVTCTCPHMYLLFVQYLNRPGISFLDFGHHHLMCQLSIRTLA